MVDLLHDSDITGGLLWNLACCYRILKVRKGWLPLRPYLQLVGTIFRVAIAHGRGFLVIRT